MGSSNNKNQQRKQDSKHLKWFMVTAVFVLSFFQYGSLKALEISIPKLIEQLGMSATEAGLSCSIAASIALFLGPLWGVITCKIGNRCVTVLGGLLMGLGLICVSVSRFAVTVHLSMALLGIGRGLPMVAKVLVIEQNFQKHFNIANAVASAGGSVGLFVLPPLTEVLYSKYGWRGGLWIVSALTFNVCVVGFLAKKKHQNKPKEEQQNRNTIGNCRICMESTGLPILARDQALCFYLASFTLLDLALSGYIFFLFTFSKSREFNDQLSSYLSALGGAGSLVGRIIFGIMLDKKAFPARRVMGLSALCGSFFLFLYPHTTSYWGLAVISLMTGIFAGTTSPVYIGLLKEMFENKPSESESTLKSRNSSDFDGAESPQTRRNSSDFDGAESPQTRRNSSDFDGAIGLHYTMRGIGMFVGAPLTGWIYDQTGSFNLAFYILAGFEAIGGILVLIKPHKREIEKYRSLEQREYCIF